MSDLKSLIAGPGILDTTQLPLSAKGAKDAKGKQSPEAVAKACEDTEKMFLTQLLKQMRKSMLSGELSQGQQAEQYWGIVEDEFSKHLAAAGGIGLGRWLNDQLQKDTVPSPSTELPKGES
jgi:Rod binding domain-containing protein